MSVALTSINAYFDHKDSGDLSKQQKCLMASVAVGRNYTRNELAELTGIRLNAICGRVFELVRDGRLEEGVARKCGITGRTAKTVKRPAADGA